MTTLEPGQREERAINEPAPTLDGASPPPGTSPTAQRDPRSRLPVDPRTGDSIPPKAQPGYYPGYHTLDNQSFWDAATRKVVLERVNDIPPVRFFTQEEAALLEAVIARVLPQDDRDAEHRIPILPHLDEKLYQGKGPGYQYRDMPPDGEVFKLGLQAIEAIALHVYNRPFQALDPHEQDYVLESIHDGRPPAGEAFWEMMSVRHFWMLLVTNVVDVYYAHPWAWDEIGFGGPAYPRGYMRLHGGEPEPWEEEEQRYPWQAPPSALSGQFSYIDLEDPLEAQLGGKPQAPGQGGTH